MDMTRMSIVWRERKKRPGETCSIKLNFGFQSSRERPSSIEHLNEASIFFTESCLFWFLIPKDPIVSNQTSVLLNLSHKLLKNVFNWLSSKYITTPSMMKRKRLPGWSFFISSIYAVSNMDDEIYFSLSVGEIYRSRSLIVSGRSRL